jgi:DNA primase
MRKTDRLARRFDDDALARRKADLAARVSIVQVVGRVVSLRKAGAAWQGLCPFHEERSPSFTVYERGNRPGFYCYGCGAKGDAIEFVMRRQGLGFLDALQLLESENGLQNLQAAPPPRPVATVQAVDRAKLDRARRLWGMAEPVVEGSPVDLYLRGRAIVPPATYGIDGMGPGGWPVDLRFAADSWHDLERRSWPAMVAAIRSHAGELLTVHRTYIARRPDGSWGKAPAEKAKLVVGSYAPGFIRLGADADAMIGGEGIESSLSAMQLWRRSGLAFVTAGRMRNVEPPFLCSDFIYAADKGGKGRHGELFAHAGARAFGASRQVAVRIPRLAADKGDFNDLLQLRAEAERRSRESDHGK